MKFRKRSKISAEFSMSSLTDVMFLLLLVFIIRYDIKVNPVILLALDEASTEVVEDESQNYAMYVMVDDQGVITINQDTVALSDFKDSLQSKAVSLDVENKVEKHPDPVTYGTAYSYFLAVDSNTNWYQFEPTITHANALGFKIKMQFKDTVPIDDEVED